MLNIRHAVAKLALAALLSAVVTSGAGLFLSRAQAGAFAAAGGATGALWSSNIVIRNDGTAPATVVVNFYSTAGVLVKSYPLPGAIPPKGAYALDTETVSDLPNGFAGSAVVSANQPVSATFVGQDVTNPGINRTMYNGFTTGSATVFVPSISNNYADQTSMLAVQNVDPTPAQVTVRYLERFTGAQTALVSINVPPNSSQFLDSANLPGGQRLPGPWTGAALIQATGGRVVAAVHQPYLSSNRAVAFEGISGIGNTVYLPSALYLYGAQGQTTFVNVQNAQDRAVTATITFYNTDGTTAGSASGAIGAYQKQSWNPGSAGIAPNFNGSAVVRAGGNIAAVANINSATDLSLAYTGQLNGTTRQSLPYIRWASSFDPKGMRTYVAAMNTDSLPSDITIKYYDKDGALLQAPGFKAVPPNAKVNHNPGTFVGDSTFEGSVEIESSRTVIGLVNAITSDGTQAESYTSIAIP